MTKSGIGTIATNSTNPITNSQANINTNPTTNQTIANAEIPIWIADKKKWVTGLSKKTTINDLIFAILKQCQLIPTTPMSNDQILDHISQKYVLIECVFDTSNTSNATGESLGNQRILNNESKVYKYLNKWNQLWINGNNSFMLKIFECQQISNQIADSTTTTVSSSLVNSELNTNNNGNEKAATSSLATKILKKFGVGSTSNNNSNTNVK